jgi:hypothetical protein
MAESKEKISAQAKETTHETTRTGTAGAEGAVDPTEEWVFTLSSATGEVLKVERIDQTGQRNEISEEEYAALVCYMDPAAAQYAAYGYDASGDAAAGGAELYQAGYHHGLADYEASVAEYEMQLASAGYGYGGASAGYQSGYSPEEAAYLQGMADYEALLG